MSETTKPSLHKFLTTFSLKGVKKKGDKWLHISVKASGKRKFIREKGIDDITLEEIWKSRRERKYWPFSSLMLLEAPSKSNGGEYKINAPDAEMIEAYMDIMEALIMGYKEIKREEKRIKS